MLDWVCTDTTLTLFHWLKMEDIYANIYVLKCYRESEKVGRAMLILQVPFGNHSFVSVTQWLASYWQTRNRLHRHLPSIDKRLSAHAVCLSAL